HVPVSSIVTDVPLTLQTSGVFVENTTVSPELAVALMPNGTGENVRFEMLGNVMVWLTLLTVKLRSTDGAGLKLAFPAWSACTVQTPAPTSVIEAGLGPLPVHTDGVVVEKLTVRPELAVALTVIGVCSIVLLVMAPNVIVWFCFTTGRLTVTV